MPFSESRPGFNPDKLKKTPDTKNRSPEKLEVPQAQEQALEQAPAAPELSLAVKDETQPPLTLENLNVLMSGELVSAPANIEIVPPSPEIAPTNVEPSPADEVEEDFSGTPSFMRRIAKNKLARAVFGMLGIINVARGLESQASQYHDLDRHEASQEQIKDVAYGSSFDLHDGGFQFKHTPDIDPSVKLDDGTSVDKHELLDKFSHALTEAIHAQYGDGLDGHVEHVADMKFSDGTHGIDALKFYAAYGDHIPMSEGGHKVLELTTGLSSNELDAYGDIMRHSVLVKPEGGIGVVKMDYYGADGFNKIDAGGDTVAHHEAQFNQVSSLIIETLQTLDYDSLTPDAQDQAKEGLEKAIHATIDTDNAWTMAANATGHWGEGTVQQDFHGQLSQLENLDTDANLAWKSVAALDHAPSGHMHELANAVTGQLEHRGHEFFSHALEIDPNSADFKAGLEHFSGDTKLADSQ